jgi:hypothetical protein
LRQAFAARAEGVPTVLDVAIDRTVPDMFPKRSRAGQSSQIARTCQNRRGRVARSRTSSEDRGRWAIGSTWR